MYLRPDDLLKYGSCFETYSFMLRYYPDGAELTEIMKHKYMTPSFLHFGFENFTTNDEEKALYYELVGIDCADPRTIYECERVKNSSLIQFSKDVVDSTEVKQSENIECSEFIYECDNVVGGRLVGGSHFIFDSQRVLMCDNITNSANVVDSVYVVDSNSIIGCKNITTCRWLRDCEDAEECYLCADCSNIKYCLFCSGIHDAEYMIFNKQVDKKKFDLISKQLLMMMKGYEMNIMGNWNTESIDWSSPTINRHYIKQYAAVPETVWKWAKTLPGYDAHVLYCITFQPHLL